MLAGYEGTLVPSTTDLLSAAEASNPGVDTNEPADPHMSTNTESLAGDIPERHRRTGFSKRHRCKDRRMATVRTSVQILPL